ncbi:hypothetical protein C1H46_010058 [Malus baccata]|uniref:Uncharacterized protein n=1 Tax=Malus baccata TaxID=106549 RepID=A0A540N180_MALBA|nr:hypothetical protein C1H46_010058 [Malus baccata]
MFEQFVRKCLENKDQEQPPLMRHTTVFDFEHKLHLSKMDYKGKPMEQLGDNSKHLTHKILVTLSPCIMCLGNSLPCLLHAVFEDMLEEGSSRLSLQLTEPILRHVLGYLRLTTVSKDSQSRARGPHFNTIPALAVVSNLVNW